MVAGVAVIAVAVVEYTHAYTYSWWHIDGNKSDDQAGRGRPHLVVVEYFASSVQTCIAPSLSSAVPRCCTRASAQTCPSRELL